MKLIKRKRKRKYQFKGKYYKGWLNVKCLNIKYNIKLLTSCKIFERTALWGFPWILKALLINLEIQKKKIIITYKYVPSN